MATKKLGSTKHTDSVLVTSASLTSEVTGVLPVSNGGTGQSTYIDGQLLIGNTSGNTLTKATLTAGTNISITNGNGSITINSTQVGVSTLINQSSSPLNAVSTSGIVAIFCDCTSAGITVNLPTAVGNTAMFVIKKVDSTANTVTVDGNASETIDGGTTAGLQVQYESITLISNNVNWMVV